MQSIKVQSDSVFDIYNHELVLPSELLAPASSRQRQRFADQFGLLDRIAGLLAIDLIAPVAEGVDNGLEVVDDFLKTRTARFDADDLDSQVLDLVPQALGYAHSGEFCGLLVETAADRADLTSPSADGAHVGDHAGLALTHVEDNGAEDGQLAEDYPKLQPNPAENCFFSLCGGAESQKLARESTSVPLTKLVSGGRA
ncbi:hypothetical protein MMC22_004793 [Lobaria immixta]|nr:hypothetical protein [Lobaria immixta]